MKNDFAKGLMAEWPEAMSAIGPITKRQGRYLVKGRITRIYGVDEIIIGNASAANQIEHGKNAAIALRRISAGNRDPNFELFEQKIRQLALENKVEIYSLKPIAIAALGDDHALMAEVEASEFDCSLSRRMVRFKIEQIKNFPHYNGLDVSCITKFEEWCKGQGKLASREREHGIIIDPLLIALMTKDDLKKLLSFIRQDVLNQLSYYRVSWGRKALEKKGIYIPPNIEIIRLRDGILTSKIHLNSKVEWETHEDNTTVTIKQKIPDSIMHTLSRKNLRDILEFDKIDPEWKIIGSNFDNNGNAYLRISCNAICVKDYLPCEAI